MRSASVCSREKIAKSKSTDKLIDELRRHLNARAMVGLNYKVDRRLATSYAVEKRDSTESGLFHSTAATHTTAAAALQQQQHQHTRCGPSRCSCLSVCVSERESASREGPSSKRVGERESVLNVRSSWAFVGWVDRSIGTHADITRSSSSLAHTEPHQPAPNQSLLNIHPQPTHLYFLETLASTPPSRDTNPRRGPE